MIGMSFLAPQHTTNVNMAGAAAEAAASSAARGQRIKCNRGLGWMTLRECVERFQAGQEEADKEKNKCARDLGCSSGRARAKMLQEGKTMANYGTCVECSRKGNRDSANRCYRDDCKKARGKKPAPDLEAATAQAPAEDSSAPLVDDLTPRDSPILDVEEVAAMDAAATSPAHDVTCHDPAAEAAALDAVMGLDSVPAAGMDLFPQPEKMVDDFTKPFSFAGFEFDPGTPTPPPGRPIARLSPSGNISFSSAATLAHKLTRFQYVLIIPDRTGSALALIFLAEKAGGARKLGTERKSGTSLKASAEAVARVAPGLVGKALEMRPMSQDGAFVAVAVVEAA